MSLIPVRLLQIHSETPTVKRFVFDVGEREFTFLPGQWIDFYAEIEGREQVGGYSLISAPQNTRQSIELAIKASPHHPVTRWLHERAQPGDCFRISPAQGACVWQPAAHKPVVLIAGGIGITPLLSIFRNFCARETEQALFLLYSASHPDEFAFGTEIRAAAAVDPRLKVWFICTRPVQILPDWVRGRARLTGNFLWDYALPLDADYFICGPRTMLFSLEAQLLSQGVAAPNIHFERW